MFNYKFIICTERNNDLRLRLTSNRKKAEVSMGIKTSQDALDDALSLKPKKENIKLSIALKRFQFILDGIKSDLLSKGRGKEEVSVIKELVLAQCFNKIPESEKPKAGTFVTHFQKVIDSKKNKGTKRLYIQCLRRIKQFDADVDNKSFEDIDLKWLTDFEAFYAKTIAKNSICAYLRNIRSVFNNAIDYEITTAYPFRRFKIKLEPTRKRSLTVEELRELFTYPVEQKVELFREMFKLIFLLIGINCVDLHGLKTITKSGRIEYKRAKTGRLYSIKVEPEAMEIIEKYQGANGLLCIADRWSDIQVFINRINKALRRIGEVERKGGKLFIKPLFPELTTYWARHSWATIAYSIGISKDVIAQALGHSDGHDVTNIYIKEDSGKVDEANRRVIDWVLYGKR